MDEPSPDSSEDDLHPSTMQETPWEAMQNSSKRDGHRCVLSHWYNLQYMMNLSHFEPGNPLLHGLVPCDPVEEARIIPIERKANTADSAQQVKVEYMEMILSRFGKTDIFEDLNADDLRHMSNMMSLNPALHQFFDSLDMCLTAVEGQSNTYRIEVLFPGMLSNIPENPVTFTSNEPNLPLPSPVLLALHRACTRVAHLSGADQYVDELLDSDNPWHVGGNWDR
ncbi:hypothetical protein EDD18DRAFT_1458934 [Armillaria luteobubalina]|uniref:HNH nuclease domain-containing protein n=1 Tax=Armillaria luteobubalina TaxID=153913 RepID=A0AA39QEK6_9AGAR|nr:hypothetical protein EDD18DRAFT_1458934 [Armillaria luteobubalina]